MSDAKHTPGPWTGKRENWMGEMVEHQVYIRGGTYEDYDDEGEDMDGGGSPTIVSTAVAIVQGNSTSKEVTAANARLIAAAPMMLDALRGSLYFAESAIDSGLHGWTDEERAEIVAEHGHVRMLRDIIAKATGGQS